MIHSPIVLSQYSVEKKGVVSIFKRAVPPRPVSPRAYCSHHQSAHVCMYVYVLSWGGVTQHGEN